MRFAPSILLFSLALCSCAVSPPQHDIRGEEFFVEGGQILLAWAGEKPNDQFGWVASPLADANGDGVADVLTCAPFQSLDGVPYGRVYLYSGRDGSLIRQHDGLRGDLLGLSVSAAGDLDGDGCTDYAASATQPRTGAGEVRIWSGRTGELIRTISDESAPEGTIGWNFGREIAEAGDWNGDGVSDMAITAPQATTAAGAQAGKVQLRSGADGSLLVEIPGTVAGGQFGTCIAASVQPQGFDQPTLVIGAMTEGEGQRGRVHVYHGAEPRPAFVIEAKPHNVNLGRFFASIPGDCDGDGVSEIYVVDFEGGSAGPGSGEVILVSVDDGREVHRFPGAAGEGLGIGNAEAGDCDGDGCADLIVGAWTHSSAAASAGRVSLYSGRTGEVLRRWTCTVAQETLGFDSVGIGDLNRDGHPDFLITGAWSGSAGEKSGRVYVVAGEALPSSTARD